jgi:hypothetical protein
MKLIFKCDNMKTNFFSNNQSRSEREEFASSSYLVLAMTALLLSPVVLLAQNGVKVSSLNVNAGTVTLDVSWNRNAPELQSIVWFDSVWVFVDYNKSGVMERLPLSTGATLTETSAPEVAHVIQYSDNDKGVWVVGNAKSEANSSGSFSATVELYYDSQTAVTGACIYASNYPPVGVFTTETGITFTGTPMYDLLLKEADGCEKTVQSGNSFFVSQNRTVQSFTDATGAPGIIITHAVYCDPGAIGDENTAPPRCTSYNAGMIGN